MPDLHKKYPPSEPCSCDICRKYCIRPGWWTVGEAKKTIEAGFADKMMLELSPELTFGVLSPAFRGNEGNVAVQLFADRGCTFLKNDLCELFGTDLRPLECRFCHHSRCNSGQHCHNDIEKDWNGKAGQRLIISWCESTGIFERYGLIPKRR